LRDVRLTPHKQDQLLVAVAAMVARDRRARNIKLNHPEVIALLTSFVHEGAREGRTVARFEGGVRRGRADPRA
jgi:urease gamma subunit